MSMSSLAVDIGAESGRIVAGELVDGRLRISEICRFANTPIRLDGTLRWDIQTLIQNVQSSINLQQDVKSVGVDTWGVDYVLIDEKHQLVEQPFHYRDARTNGVMERLASRQIYRETGIQFLPFNTIFQLAATPHSILDKAKHFLTIPDYIHYQLSAEQQIVCEFTNATTTQLVCAENGLWSTSLIDQQGFPTDIFPTIIQPGTSLGRTKNGQSEIVAPACHDTGSAVVAIPSTSADVAWISSGTWSILGVEQALPLISDESYRLNYTNEGGVFGNTRLCKNVMGLWILQQCRAEWGEVSYSTLQNEAKLARSTGSSFDPDDPRFLSPNSDESRMEDRINDYLFDSNQNSPTTRGEMVRLILESLANKYSSNIDDLESLIGRRINQIHIFGGGSQNELLNQLTANACARPVIAGPVEATAIGNLLMQMISLREISSLSEARQIVRNSFECRAFQPQN